MMKRGDSDLSRKVFLSYLGIQQMVCLCRIEKRCGVSGMLHVIHGT